jgi:hypothetical protein
MRSCGSTPSVATGGSVVVNKIPFKYHMHDDYSGAERAGIIAQQTGLDPEDEALWQRVGRPFYEVTLECTLDPATGRVELVKATL